MMRSVVEVDITPALCPGFFIGQEGKMLQWKDRFDDFVPDLRR
jgi:hypothetical protein